MVQLAEQGLGEQSTLDTACQEMLSHAASNFYLFLFAKSLNRNVFLPSPLSKLTILIGRVNQSQIECIEARNVLKICELKQDVANNRVTKLQSQLKSAIKASRYYEIRVELVFVCDHNFSIGNQRIFE